MMLFGSVSAILFLSTPSARRATKISNIAFAASSNFYPRPPRGGRQRSCILQLRMDNFYPRPPRGGRHNARNVNSDGTLFLSTPSARRATCRL